ncbi:DUF485 domain-containing protein [Cupriavidus sp. 2TAF22]|uniref:DUF485 domain-containing protein n=1 Tax=unclassified Cupriavidus TaxID=2640874 RepID=UPI003F9169D4
MTERIGYAGIQSNPVFKELVSRRRRLTILLSAVTIVPYCIFILVAALSPGSLASRLSGQSNITIGWAVGAMLILGCWLLTGFYVRQANVDFDRLTERLALGAEK